MKKLRKFVRDLVEIEESQPEMLSEKKKQAKTHKFNQNWKKIGLKNEIRAKV